MKIFMIILVLTLTAFAILGCKVKQEKTLDEMDKATKVVAETLDEVNEKVDKDAVEVAKQPVGVAKQPVAPGEPAQSWLDRYEAIVVSYEKKVAKGTLTATDIVTINFKLAELSQKAEQHEGWTVAQVERLGKLTARLTAVVSKYRP